jgi:serine/threonine-protein kinase
VLRNVSFELWKQLSPDGRWLAYSSAEEGRDEIYLTPFPKADRRWRVSSAGGLNPSWRRDGRELLFQQPDGQIMRVALAPSGDEPGPGKPEPLFRLRRVEPWGSPVALFNDGKRFLVIPPPERETAGELRLVLNWPARM